MQNFVNLCFSSIFFFYYQLQLTHLLSLLKHGIVVYYLGADDIYQTTYEKPHLIHLFFRKKPT